MKRLLTFIILLTLVSGSIFAQNPITTVEFTPALWNFGQIAELDGVVSHVFKYRNTGDKPYVIYEIATSCGCTTPSYDRSPLMPNQEREMTINFDPVNQPGPIEKTIMVRGNIEGGTTVLKIRATVEPRPKTIEDDYPVALTDGVRLQDIVLEIGTSPNSKTSTATLGIVNTSNKPIKITLAKEKLPAWINAKPQSETLSANQKSNIIVTLTPNDKMWGRYAFVMPILVNGRSQFLNPTGNTIFVEDFPATSSSTTQARASLSTYFYHFSTIKQNSTHSYKFTIKNSGTTTLHLRYFDHSENISVESDKHTLTPNQVATVIIKPLTTKIGPINEIIRIITNDPIKPVQEFRTMANIIGN